MTLEQLKLRTKVTQADLDRLDAQGLRVEVEDGEIIIGEQGMTALHILVIKNLYDLLNVFVVAHTLGIVLMDGMRYILEALPEEVERAYVPDLSFLRTGRIPADFNWMGDFVGAPDLAVEIASPGQSNVTLINKLGRYLANGTEEAWLIYPWRAEIYQYRRDADAPQLYTGAQVITTPLFHGLEIVAERVFAKPG
jgi:Uma2 family endonuclease